MGEVPLMAQNEVQQATHQPVVPLEEMRQIENGWKLIRSYGHVTKWVTF